MLKYFKSQKSYGFLITKELIFGFQILDLKDHFSASLNCPGEIGLKQPKAKPSLKDQKKLVEKASESISHKVVSKDSKQGSSQMLMDSVKNLPCRKLEGQLKFKVPDRGVKENTTCSMCGKKEPDDQECDDEEFDGNCDVIID